MVGWGIISLQGFGDWLDPPRLAQVKAISKGPHHEQLRYTRIRLTENLKDEADRSAMKQVVQNLRDGQTSVVEVPVPSPKPGMALVRTSASLVSAGTERMLVAFAEKSLIGKARSRPDLVRQMLDKARREGVLTTVEAAFNRLDQPMPLGYSSAGTIVAIGEELGEHGFQVGQRVACAGGGYAVHAEYVLVPYNLLAPLPENVDFESAAFTTLGAISMHGFRLAEAQIGETVAVIGLGLLGLLAYRHRPGSRLPCPGDRPGPAPGEVSPGFWGQGMSPEDAVEAAAKFHPWERLRCRLDLRRHPLQRPGRACRRDRTGQGQYRRPWSSWPGHPTQSLFC